MRPDGIRGVVLDLDDTLTDLASFELEVWDDVAKMLAAAAVADSAAPWGRWAERLIPPRTGI